MKRRRRFWQGEAASAAVEAALVSPVLIILALAAIDAANLVLTVHRVEAGLASGAALLERTDAPLSHAGAARNLAVSGQTAAGGSLNVPGWSADLVQVSVRSIANPNGTYRGGEVRVVRLETEFAYVGFGLLRLAGVGALQVRAAHEERVFGGPA